MKPNVIIYLLFSLFLIIISWEEQNALAVASFHENVNKEEAVRLRILANSDSIADQSFKRHIRDKVNVVITSLVVDIQTVADATEAITDNIKTIEQIVETEMKKHGLSYTYDVTFSKEEFPTRLYGNIVYPAGEYNAVVITIGEGKGENWWCVLFPPLCFLEIGTDEEEHEHDEEVEISFFIADLFSMVQEQFFSSNKV